MAWLIATFFALALVSGALSWAFYRLCAENVLPDAENHAKWHSYFGWSTFFQGTGLAFLTSSVVLIIVEVIW